MKVYELDTEAPAVSHLLVVIKIKIVECLH